MRLAYLQAEGGATNRLLADFAETARARGLRVIGTVQVNTDRPGGGPGEGRCDMDVTVLPSGPVLRISQDLGPGSRGCRLDPAALEEAVARTEAALAAGADLMIVNKFGKHEAEGRGFRALIGAALAEGVPVVVGLNGLNAAAFAAFGAGLAQRLDASPEALLSWLEEGKDDGQAPL
ncbi:DUF2478 domain-containing protein [Rhodobacter capsulatus]|uniref:DUF2478 domain-containing protein n=1 Tax=Rhodobacter capsulatus TaxID=1061 RepID=A0A4U1JQZ1_RHOCA|nr:DUF2478 domain-containing protein [Rhodobacter capsulatus]TKD21399.1 DUF2478 domain-containing protein [Rhodobacter capsulatus]